MHSTKNQSQALRGERGLEGAQNTEVVSVIGSDGGGSGLQPTHGVQLSRCFLVLAHVDSGALHTDGHVIDRMRGGPIFHLTCRDGPLRLFFPFKSQAGHIASLFLFVFILFCFPYQSYQRQFWMGRDRCRYSVQLMPCTISAVCLESFIYGLKSEHGHIWFVEACILRKTKPPQMCLHLLYRREVRKTAAAQSG